MERQTWREKMISTNNVDEKLEEDLNDDETIISSGNGYVKTSGNKKSATAASYCQPDRCGADLGEAKIYHRRHKVCEFHSKAAVVVVSGARQRFCQQCSRFHEIGEFDDAKRSCRRRLAGHNERRRKSASEPYNNGEGSTSSSHRGITTHQYRSESTAATTKYMTIPPPTKLC